MAMGVASAEDPVMPGWAAISTSSVGGGAAPGPRGLERDVAGGPDARNRLGRHAPTSSHYAAIGRL